MPAPTPILARRADAPPLDPSPEQAREWVRDELGRSGWDAVQRWFEELLRGAHTPAPSFGPAGQLVAMVLFALLLALLAVLASRLRTSGPGRRDRASNVVLTGAESTAAELRDLARRLLAEGDLPGAYVAGFRALALARIESGELLDQPGLTAREVAVQVALQHPSRRDDLTRAATGFDAVLYGEQPTDAETVGFVLALEARLDAERPGLRGGPR